MPGAVIPLNPSAAALGRTAIAMGAAATASEWLLGYTVPVLGGGKTWFKYGPDSPKLGLGHLASPIGYTVISLGGTKAFLEWMKSRKYDKFSDIKPHEFFGIAALWGLSATALEHVSGLTIHAATKKAPWVYPHSPFRYTHPLGPLIWGFTGVFGLWIASKLLIHFDKMEGYESDTISSIVKEGVKSGLLV